MLGPWVNQRWLNILASIIGVLLTLSGSGTLVVCTVFPALNVTGIAIVLAIALLVGGEGLACGWRSPSAAGAGPGRPRCR